MLKAHHQKQIFLNESMLQLDDMMLEFDVESLLIELFEILSLKTQEIYGDGDVKAVFDYLDQHRIDWLIGKR